MTWLVLVQTHTLTQTKEVRRDAERLKGDREHRSPLHSIFGFRMNVGIEAFI